MQPSAPNTTVDYIKNVTDMNSNDNGIRVQKVLGAEVMLVGFSQGGIIAQTLADDGSSNTKEVLTYGAPELVSLRNFGGGNMVHLMHDGDPVPVSQILTNNVVTQLVSALMTEFTGNEQPENGSSIKFHAGAFDLESHNPTQYSNIADQFDNSVRPDVVAARDSQRRFEGTVVSDRR